MVFSGHDVPLSLSRRVGGAGLLLALVVLQPVPFSCQLIKRAASTFSEQDDQPVRVQFFGEAECPDCREFVVEVGKALLAFPEAWNMFEFEYTEYGNAYFATDACGSGPYSPTERECFFKRCIRVSQEGTSIAPSDCFTGPTVYQHHPPDYPGPAAREGRLMLAESCAKKFALFPTRTAANLLVCMEGDLQDQYTAGPDGGVAALVQACGERSGADVRVLAAEVLSEKCLGMETTGDPGGFQKMWRAYEVANALATPDHAGVPYVLLDGVAMDNPMGLVAAVCKKLGPERTRAVAACQNTNKEVGGAEVAEGVEQWI